jgi:hypothetical protein
MATESKKPAGARNSGQGPSYTEGARRQLRDLARLQPGWDGYGAPVIEPAIIEAACRFVGELPDHASAVPRIVPMSGGNLQFEWHRGAKVLELEFETAERIRFLQWDPESELEEEDEFPVTDIDSAAELIHWFESGALG